MSKNLKVLGGTLFGAAVVLAAAALPASAATSGTTDTTFTLTAGTIDITVAANAALTNGASGATSVSGKLGDVTVADNRGGTANWTVSAASTAFTSTTGSTTSSSTAVSYNSGAITSTGTVTAASSGTVAVSAIAAPVATGTLVSGNNTATWNPTLTVTLPASSLAGTYAGTVTTSVA